MVAFENFILVNSRLVAMSLWESIAFKEVKKRESEAALIIVLVVYYGCFLY